MRGVEEVGLSQEAPPVRRMRREPPRHGRVAFLAGSLPRICHLADVVEAARAYGRPMTTASTADTVRTVAPTDVRTRLSRVIATIGSGSGNDGGVEDGPVGFRDTLAPTVENLTGGSGNDSLTGNDLANVLVGGLGADSLFGLAGVDTLNAADGIADTVIDCGADTDNVALSDSGIDPAPVSCP